MNLIVLSTDTLRADYLGCYGNAEVRTPNIDRLAAEGVLFENAFAEGLPTLEARRVYFTGRRLFPTWEAKPHKGDHLGYQPGWHAFDEREVTIAEVLQSGGYTTALITDVYHMFKPTGNFHRGFDCWRWIRGQEADPYVTGPRDKVDFSAYVKPGTYKRRRFQGLEQYLLNTLHRNGEEDYFTAQVMSTAIRWIEDNVGNQPFFMWVDCFDPHEPWDPPKRFADMYCSDYEGPEFIWPDTRAGDYTEAELRRIRALYMGEITFLDEWIGRVLETLDRIHIAEDTLIAFTSDHGTLLGEQGILRKKHHMLIKAETRVPFVLRGPGLQSGQRIEAFVQAPDFMPTWFDLLGEHAPPTATGQTLRPLLEGEAGSLYDYVITAYGCYASVRDLEWNYVAPYCGPFHPKEKVEPRQLYDLRDDPGEERNVAEDHRGVVETFADRLRRRLEGPRRGVIAPSG